MYFASYVDNTPLREKFYELLAEGESISEIAARGGWIRKDDSYRIPRGDGAPLKRALGILPHRTRHNAHRKQYVTYAKCIRPATAERLCRALNVDPYEVGV
jgi:hypothetical protein